MHPDLTVVGAQKNFLFAIPVSLRLHKTRLSMTAECTTNHHGDTRLHLTPLVVYNSEGLCYAHNGGTKKMGTDIPFVPNQNPKVHGSFDVGYNPTHPPPKIYYRPETAQPTPGPTNPLH